MAIRSSAPQMLPVLAGAIIENQKCIASLVQVHWIPRIAMLAAAFLTLQTELFILASIFISDAED